MAPETVHPHPEDARNRIQNQITLLQWIEDARAMQEEVRSARRHDKRVEDLMKDHGVRDPIYWGAQESEALQFSLLYIAERVDALAALKTEAKHV